MHRSVSRGVVEPKLVLDLISTVWTGNSMVYVHKRNRKWTPALQNLFQFCRGRTKFASTFVIKFKNGNKHWFKKSMPWQTRSVDKKKWFYCFELSTFFTKKIRPSLNQNQNSLLVKRQTDNTTPGGMGLDQRGLVPSSHKRSKFRHTIIWQFSRGDQRNREFCLSSDTESINFWSSPQVWGGWLNLEFSQGKIKYLGWTIKTIYKI